MNHLYDEPPFSNARMGSLFFINLERKNISSSWTKFPSRVMKYSRSRSISPFVPHKSRCSQSIMSFSENKTDIIYFTFTLTLKSCFSPVSQFLCHCSFSAGSQHSAELLLVLYTRSFLFRGPLITSQSFPLRSVRSSGVVTQSCITQAHETWLCNFGEYCKSLVKIKLCKLKTKHLLS